MLSTLLATAVAVAPVVSSSTDHASVQRFFRSPERSLEVPAGTDSTFSLGELMAEYVAVTGINTTSTEACQSALDRIPTGLRKDLLVPAGDVHAVVQGLLHQHGFAVAPVHVDDPRVLWIWSPSLDEGLRPRFATVGPEHRALGDELPALLVSVTADVDSVDARQLPTLMRPMLHDVRDARIVATSSERVTLAGRAGDVFDWLAMIESFDGVAGGAAARGEELPPAELLFPLSTLEPIERVLTVVDALATDAGSFDIDKISGGSRPGKGVTVKLNVAVKAADIVQATALYGSLVELLKSKDWCASATDTGTSVSGEGEVRTTLTVETKVPSELDVPVLNAGEASPSTVVRALAVSDRFALGGIDIKNRNRRTPDALQTELTLRLRAPAYRDTLVEYAKALEERLPGARVSSVKIFRRQGPAFGFDATLVWRERLPDEAK